jgi:hypothetical protein
MCYKCYTSRFSSSNVLYGVGACAFGLALYDCLDIGSRFGDIQNASYQQIDQARGKTFSRVGGFISKLTYIFTYPVSGWIRDKFAKKKVCNNNDCVCDGGNGKK